MDLKTLALKAAGVRTRSEDCRCENVLFGLVPITAGEGIIEGFTETIAAILKHLGFLVYVTTENDVAGIAEAYERSVQVVMLADDQRFIAIRRDDGKIIDNCEATARGFVVALAGMAEGLRGKTVLVLGCGNVGNYAALALSEGGSEVLLYDIDPARAQKCAASLHQVSQARVMIQSEKPSGLRPDILLFDATPAKGIIDENLVLPQTQAACPGVPIGLTEGASRKLHGRFIHDPLQIGVATMAMAASFGLGPIQWPQK
jgi:pyrrolysine biosynthesis protein PylD